MCPCQFPPAQTVSEWRKALERLDSTAISKRKDKGNQSSVGQRLRQGIVWVSEVKLDLEVEKMKEVINELI